MTEELAILIPFLASATREDADDDVRPFATAAEFAAAELFDSLASCFADALELFILFTN
jgi:hypothetical protein